MDKPAEWWENWKATPASKAEPMWASNKPLKQFLTEQARQPPATNRQL
jgi:hypothetical protein